jgi:hypothetical protein
MSGRYTAGGSSGVANGWATPEEDGFWAAVAFHIQTNSNAKLKVMQ